MKKCHYILLLLFLSVSLILKAQNDTSRRYIKVPDGYLMVLRQNDDVFHQLKQLAENEKIPSANLSAMGFVNITFGFYDFASKNYEPKTFKNVELASMSGTIAWQQDTVSLHCHGLASGKNFKAYGGHILAATVSTGSCEIHIITYPQRLLRFKDEQIGANVLGLE